MQEETFFFGTFKNATKFFKKAHQWISRVCVTVFCVTLRVYLFVQNWLLQSIEEKTHSFILGLLSDTFPDKI